MTSLESPSSDADQSDPFPSRLIYVPLSFELEPCRLRLINSKDLLREMNPRVLTAYPPYVTLSHRWGSTQNFTTTKANLHSRQSGFTLQDLPRTYRDAAIVTARLGFSYLWIDAICIMQDDPEEWLWESEKMGAIYRHAKCTIASHCSENDDSGFLEAALRKRGSVKFR